MPPYLNEWLMLLLRWVHFVTGVTWIGTSFYFNWLNNNVRGGENLPPGVKGDLWTVHGGGFYRVLKYDVAPGQLPSKLHWFKWEAYLTWLTGFSLLGLMYYHGATLYLLEPGSPLSPKYASLLGAGSLIVGWIIYDVICRSPLVRTPKLMILVLAALAVAAAWGYTLVFTGRGAYIHFGSLLGTLMAWNVFVVIIPGQKRMVEAITAGREPDPQYGIAGARRSRHNNYLTLPVLFIMISNHYPFTYQHEWNWAVLAVIAIGSACVRHWFNVRGEGHRNVWILPAATAMLLGLAFQMAPRTRAGGVLDPTGAVPAFAEVYTIVTTRCATCHSANPTDKIFRAAPNGVTFDRPEEIIARVKDIHERTVVTRQMPLGNLTEMTDAERDVLARWFAGGAPLE